MRLPKEVDPAVRKLRDAVDEAHQTLSRYQKTQRLAEWKTIVVTVFSTLLASLLMVKLMMPEPTLPLTDSMIDTYHNGSILGRAWPKLSPHQKQVILDTARAQ